jgi:hypothetical protein
MKIKRASGDVRGPLGHSLSGAIAQGMEIYCFMLIKSPRIWSETVITFEFAWKPR